MLARSFGKPCISCSAVVTPSCQSAEPDASDVCVVCAGQKVRTKTQDSFVKLGHMTQAVLAEMLKLSLLADGLPQGAKGAVEGPDAVDTGGWVGGVPLTRWVGGSIKASWRDNGRISPPNFRNCHLEFSPAREGKAF